MEADTPWACPLRLGSPDSGDREKRPGFISYCLNSLNLGFLFIIEMMKKHHQRVTGIGRPSEMWVVTRRVLGLKLSGAGLSGG